MEDKEILLQQYSSLILDYVEYQKFMENEIENLLIKNNIKYHSLTSRIKSINSLSKKLDNGGIVKRLKKDIKNLNDVCGLRITLYDSKNLSKIRDIICDTYEIKKYKNARIDYNANNITVKLKDGKFKEFQCEIQLVTVMSHNLIEIGHDIVYKDKENLKQLDPKGYEMIKEDYDKYLLEIYELEAKVDSIKTRAVNIKNDYNLYKKIVSDKYIGEISDNTSLSKFYDICNDISSLIGFLSRNMDKAEDFLNKKIMIKLTKTIPNLKEDGILGFEFVFDNYTKMLSPYCNVWSCDIEEMFNVLISFLIIKKNDRMNKSFLEMIKHIIISDIKDEKWIIFDKIKEWIISNDNYPEYRIRITNSIINDTISYAEEVDALKLNIITKKLEYSDEGKNLISNLFEYCCNIFVKNQNRIIYNELISFIYKFSFLANETLKFFYDNYEKINDIYKFDLIRKIYYSYKDIVLDDKYYKKLKSEGIYDIFKFLVYDYFDEELERKNWKQIQKKAKRIINNYIKDINGKNIEEINRLLECYDSLIEDNQQIPFLFEKFIYDIGHKYNQSKELYKNHPISYLYLGILKSGKKIKNRNDIEILNALEHIYVASIFNQLLIKRKNNIDKDIIFCRIIIKNHLYNKKNIKNKVFKIIDYYNQRKKFLNNIYISREFIERITPDECNIILENYKYGIKECYYYDVDLRGIFEVYPQNYRDWLYSIIKKNKIEPEYPLNIYITSCENYEEERKNNILFILKLLKEYEYYEIYKYVGDMYNFNEKEVINDLITIVQKDDSIENLLAVSKFLCKLEVGLETWRVIRLILLKTDNETIKKHIFNSFIDVGTVNSFADTYKARVVKLKELLKQESEKKLQKYLRGLIDYYDSNTGVEELREFKYKSELKIRYDTKTKK